MFKTWSLPAAALLALTAPATAGVRVGAPAPDFTLTDISGKSVKLSAFRGRTVVLEWNNLACPFCGKHYGTGNMQRTQSAAKKAGFVWLTINSGAGVSPSKVKTSLAMWKGNPSDYLLDPNGTVGQAYGAKTTPHLVIIDRTGKLVYQGSIDDKPTLEPADIRGAENYVLRAVGEIRAGKQVSIADTRPYGCPIKYAD